MTRDDQRHEIARLLLTGQWRGARTREELSARWGCKAADIYRLTGEAAGAIRLSKGDGWSDEINLALGELEALQSAAWQQGDLAAVLAIIKTKLTVYGAFATGTNRPVGPPYHETKAREALRAMGRPERIALLKSALAEEMSAPATRSH